MEVEDGKNGVWRADIEGHSPTFIASLFHKSTFQKKAGRPRKYKGSWFSAKSR